LGDRSIYPLAILPDQVKNKVRSLELRWDPLSDEMYRNCFPLQLELQGLRSWPNLQTLMILVDPTVSVDEGWVNDQMLRALRAWSRLDSPFNAHLEILRAARANPFEGASAGRGYLSHLKRSIAF
jgi:hypothetical protein